MKKLFLTTCVSFFSFMLFAQIGIIGSYKTFDPTDWLQALNTEQGGGYSSMEGFGLGVDYWFRLKNKRIEFTPEISYNKFSSSSGEYDLEHQLISFHFNTNIYLFDLANDCDCPTFSKDGNIFTKGFFIQISPGVSRFDNELQNLTAFSDNGFAFEIGAGAGVDIGVSDLITITPIVKYYYTPSATWENFQNRESEIIDVDSSIGQFYAGLKVGFRYKQENSFRRR